MNEQPSVAEIIDHVRDNFDYQTDTGDAILSQINETMDLADVAKNKFPVMAQEKQLFDDADESRWRDITLYGEGQWCVAVELDCSADGKTELLSYGFFGNGPSFSDYLESIRPNDGDEDVAQREPEQPDDDIPGPGPNDAATMPEDQQEYADDEEDDEEEIGEVNENEASLLDMMANENPRFAEKLAKDREPSVPAAAKHPDVREAQNETEAQAGAEAQQIPSEPSHGSNIRGVAGKLRSERGEEPISADTPRKGFFSRLAGWFRK